MSIWVVSQKQRLLSHVGQRSFLFLRSRSPATTPPSAAQAKNIFLEVKKHEKDSYKGKCPYHGDCLEGVAAGPAIEERWGLKGDELHVNHEAWEMEAFYLAQALVNFILIVSPEKIIMGGGVMKQEQLFPLIRKEVIKQLNGYINKKEILEDIDNYIVAPKLGDNAGLCGAVSCGLAARRARSRHDRQP